MKDAGRVGLGRLTGRLRSWFGRWWWLWGGLAAIGVATNAGTAAGRLSEILPAPHPLDFASYYAGGWATRLGGSAYYWPPDLLLFLKATQGMTVAPTPPVSPPPWVWLMQIFTLLPFQAAAWAWLAIQLGLIVWCSRMLLAIAGHSGWKGTLWLAVFVATFGPVFLCLTIGQNAVLPLAGALVMGRYLGGKAHRASGVVVGWVLAVITKLFPLLWYAAVFPLRRRLAVVMAVATGAVLAGSWLVQPVANQDYWRRFLPDSGRGVLESVSVDDQSVEARVALLARTNTLSFEGGATAARHETVWRPPWDLSAGTVRVISLILVLGLGAAVVAVWLRSDAPRHSEALFYLVVLFSLVPLPHMERYNHTLLLPAMAWLWAQGRTYRWLTVTAYCLVGLSRLNHLWALVLPWPLGALATGTCLYSALLLGWGISHRVLALRGRPAPQ
jgi:hypothetical protein